MTLSVITITKIKPIEQTDALFTYQRCIRENGTNKIIENLRANRTLRSVTAALITFFVFADTAKKLILEFNYVLSCG